MAISGGASVPCLELWQSNDGRRLQHSFVKVYHSSAKNAVVFDRQVAVDRLLAGDRIMVSAMGFFVRDVKEMWKRAPR